MKVLNTKHLMFILLGVTIVSIKTYPTIFTILGGRDTWIAMIISSVLIFLIIDFLLLVCKSKNCFNIYQIYTTAVGKTVGFVLMGLLLLTVFLNILESTSVEASAMHEHFLLFTPQWLFITASILVALYVVKRNASAVITTTLIAIVMISSSGIILAIMTQKYKDFNYLLPIFGSGVSGSFILCVLKLLGAYGCAFLIFPYIELIEDKSRIIRHTNYAMIFMGQIQIFAMMGTIATFDIKRLNTMIYPKLTQTQMVSYFGFLEAGELFVMLQIVAGWLMKYILCFFAFLLFMNIFHIKFKFQEYVISVIALIFSFFVGNNLFALTHALNALMYIQLVNYILIPLVVFTIFLYSNKPIVPQASTLAGQQQP